MTDSFDGLPPATPEGSPDDEIAEAVGRYVDDLTAGREVDPMRVVVENPGIGHEVLKRVEEFLGVRDEEIGSLGTLGDYSLRRQIGRGGMGTVYDAWQNSMDRRVALKVLPRALAADTRSSSLPLRQRPPCRRHVGIR